MKTLLPTGSCWCGCGTATDVGAFFAAGHDKRAESRLIMNVFGGVPQFVAAFGYQPGGDRVPSGAGIEAAARLLGLGKEDRETLILEHSNDGDRAGALLRCGEARCTPFDLSEGSATFTVTKGAYSNAVVIPFVDLVSVYRDGRGWVVRIAGSVVFEDPRILYRAYGSAAPAAPTPFRDGLLMLLVDDEFEGRDFLIKALSGHPREWNVEVFSDAKKAARLAAQTVTPFAVVAVLRHGGEVARAFSTENLSNGRIVSWPFHGGPGAPSPFEGSRRLFLADALMMHLLRGEGENDTVRRLPFDPGEVKGELRKFATRVPGPVAHSNPKK
jgi:hypothetical protein